jgi:hypothetical protein
MYQTAKQSLKEIAKTAKQNYTNDLPAIRMIINDEVDYLCKDHKLTDYQRVLLCNYACNLHPKK